MNYSTAVMLINTNIRAIKTLYEPDDVDSKGTVTRKKVRTVFKTLDPTIKAGDIVVVPSGTRHGFTTNLVEEVDVDVDFEDSTEIKWIVDKIALTGYNAVLAEEKTWIDECKKAEKRDKAQKLKDKMFAYYKEAGNTNMALLAGTVDNVEIKAVEAPAVTSS